MMGKQESTVAEGNAERPVILAIDIGTSGVKILLYDRMGREVEGIRWSQAFEIRTSAGGASEIDPDRLLEVVWRGIDAMLAKAGPMVQDIAGVATCTLVGNIMGIDQQGRPLTPVFTYADTRAESEVAWLGQQFDETAVHDRTGCHFHSSYLPARFRWLGQTQPDVIRRAAHWISIGEYIERQLFGESGVSYSVASWSGLLDRKRLIWASDLLNKLPVDIARLSPLVDIDALKKGLKSEFASRWPALKNLPWVPAIGDGAAANVGSGCVSPSHVALTIGSTTAVRAVVTASIDHIPRGLWCYRVDGRRSLPGGALSEGGSLFAWIENTFRIEDGDKLAPALELLPPDGHGLTVLPFLSGERSPGWQGRARATFHGISQATTALEIMRAAMEAVAYRIALVMEKLAMLLPDNFQIVASGGAIRRSPVWQQIITDVLGRRIAVAGIQEASARGSALLALEAMGLIEEIKDIPSSIEHTCYPDDERHSIYLDALERHKGLYDILVKDNRSEV